MENIDNHMDIQKKKEVLYVTEGEKSIQYRYRCKNLFDALMQSKKWKMDICLMDKVDEADINNVSLVVIERQAAKQKNIVSFIKKIKRNGISVLYDIDDLVFDFRDLPGLMWNTNSRNIFYWGAYFGVVWRVARRVDGFLCTNDFLGKKLKRSFNKPYRVIPNSLNKEQVEISEKIAKKKKSSTGKNFSIGYFSGSPTHTKDFRMVEPELVKFLKDHDDAILKVVGDMEYSSEMTELVKEGKIQVSEKVDYLSLQKLISEVNVNIAPLVINDFTNCKSELKFFEAAVVETTTIASPSYAFKKAIKDGENGFLAQPGEWYDKLEYLYKHPEENKKIAKRAKEYALKHYYGKGFLRIAEEVYDFFTNA